VDDYRASTPTAVEVTVSVGDADLTGFDFGYRRLATIGDLVWLDANDDGLRGADESPIAGVTLKLIDAKGVERGRKTTDANGAYFFKVLPGDWTVAVIEGADALSGHRPTTPSSLTIPVTVDGASALNYDFGYQPSAGAGDSAISVNTLDSEGRDGRCSLAEALRAAETDETVDGCLAGSGHDKIYISVLGMISAPRSGFQVESSVTVQGNPGGTTVSGGGGFDVVVTDNASMEAATVTDVTLDNMTIGAVFDSAVSITDAAGSALDTAYTVVLENLHLEKSVEAGVGFVRAFASRRPGRVEVRNSVLEGNGGGGVYLDACDPNSSSTVMKVTNSIIRANVGGARNECGHLMVVDSTISGNVFAGGVRALGGRRQGGGGGSARLASTHTELINVTITKNTSRSRGVGVALSGSGELKPTLTIANSTIADNVDSSFGSRRGDGIHQVGPADVSITNTVVAGNDGDQCGDKLTLAANSGNASSDDSCGFGLENASASLQGLADNGGAAPVGPNGGMGNVYTMAIDATSPLHDAGHAASCQATDARGQPRPQGGVGCDIGAYETQ